MTLFKRWNVLNFKMGMILPITLFFILGTLFGSFLNAYSHRLSKGLTMRGRSQCIHCSHTLPPQDLIPLVSFLLLLGKCRFCKKKIPLRYPLVELATGCAFVLPVIVGGFSPLTLALHQVFLALLVAVFVYDIRFLIIPDVYVLGLFFIALFLNGVEGTLIQNILPTLLFTLPFFLIWKYSHGRAMGFGDVKLAVPLSLVAGKTALYSLFVFSFIIGAIFSLFLMFLQRKKYSLKSKIPFAPFLITSFLLVVFRNMNALQVLDAILYL